MDHPLKVLILEDVQADALLMVHELKNAGFLPDWMRVDTENSYLTALASGPDLILSDYHLPQFDAFLALQLMQDQKLDIPFIVISGAITEDVAVEFMKRGASDYLLKDRMARLGQAVVRALEQRELHEEKRRNEEALRESEALYSAVVGQAFDIIFLVDVKTRSIIDGNIAFQEMLGFSSNDLSGLTLYDIVAHDKENIERNIDRIKASGNYFIGQRQYRRKDGSIIEVEASSNLIRYGKKEVLCVIARDITERKLAEEALRESEEQLAYIIDFLPDATFAIDREGKVIAWNRATEEMTGAAKNEVIGKKGFAHAIPFYGNARPILIDLVFRDQKDIEKEYDFVLRKGDQLTAEVFAPLLYKGKGAYLWGIAAPLYDSKGNIVGAIESIRDITEHKQIEDALTKKSEELARSNADLAQFAYAASHDLQEPLRTITSFVQLLQKRYHGKIDPDADEFIDFIVGGTKRMQQLINDLLTYSRVNTRKGPLSPMKIEDVLQKAMQNLRYILEEVKGTVIYEEMPSIVADEPQMTQLFQNLIGNALKFHGEEAPKVEISAARKGNDWIFSVKDNGIGIDPQYKDRIFEIFQRLHTREEYSGTGIGLAIAKKIVERHGGRIWVDGEPGKGTTFRFTIPAMIDRDPNEVDLN
jgi:PAS domain S-box-containing protein